MRTREAQREYQRNWIRKRREEWIAANGPCIDCGSDERLEVDHRDYSQKINHKVWSWSQSRRDAELAKCDVRCNSCHQAKTNAENSVRNGAERNGNAKLTPAQVVEIRERSAAGATGRQLAKEYGVGEMAISKIIRRKSWKQVA